MKELTIGEQKVRVRATPLALLYYKQSFKTDLLGDLTKMEQLKKDQSKLDSVFILQLVWAMAKADAYGKDFSSFDKWISELESFDFSDELLMTAVMEEAADGFFRKAQQKGNAKK